MAGYQKNAFCSYCGSEFTKENTWPKACKHCRKVTYLNPIPVAVVLLPVDKGLLTIRRDIEPRKDQLALPGGFIDLGETWQKACSRELKEETGIEIFAEEITEFAVRSAPDSTVLIFGVAKRKKRSELPSFQASNETSEMVIISAPQKLAFPLHTEMVNKFFENRK